MFTQYSLRMHTPRAGDVLPKQGIGQNLPFTDATRKPQGQAPQPHPQQLLILIPKSGVHKQRKDVSTLRTAHDKNLSVMTVYDYLRNLVCRPQDSYLSSAKLPGYIFKPIPRLHFDAEPFPTVGRLDSGA